MLTDSLAIQFHIPARDPLGRREVLGKLRFLPKKVELSWCISGNVFTGGNSEMTITEIPYPEIEHVELVKKWFKIRRIIFRVSDPALVHGIPGVEMGKMTLEIDERSRSEAKKLEPLIDFQKSMFILDTHQQRLDGLRKENSVPDES